ncbi:serine/threonine protein kinase [Streptomyces sp. NPDC059175]|uniref:serine/threonine protein kinase n=1 Tax=unclassified Streptomyces TaxID=2593676 RepID=UPI0036AE8BD4
MDDYAGRVLADRYRLPLPPSDAYELVETRAFDTYSGHEVLVRQVPLPEVVEAEFLDADGAPGAAAPRRAPGRTTRRPTDPAVRRAMEAAQAAAQIPDHPLLDQVFDVFAEGGSLWIVSELVAARPLAALLAEEPLDPYRAAEIGSDLLTALRALHAHGWTHRNITVRTVLVCDDGRVVLTGLAVGAAEEALCGYVPVPEPAEQVVDAELVDAELVDAPDPDAPPEAEPYAFPQPYAEDADAAADDSAPAVPHQPEDAYTAPAYGYGFGDGSEDVRAARADAIAAYRAGTRAAARTGEDRRKDEERRRDEARRAEERRDSGHGGTEKRLAPAEDGPRSAPGGQGALPGPGYRPRGADGAGRLHHPGVHDEQDGHPAPVPGALPAPRAGLPAPQWWSQPADGDGYDEGDGEDDLYEVELPDQHSGRYADPHADPYGEPPSGPRRARLAGVWRDGPPGADGPAPLPAGGGASPYEGGGHGDPSEPGNPPGGTGSVHGQRGPAGRWDEVVSGALVPAYRGPATPLAAERARQTRIAVVGAVTERWAPEQAGPVHENWQLAPPIGPATDLWALGALLYRAVQGHAPYPEDSAAELVQLVCAEPPAFAEECGPMRPVVESLLRQDPTERPDFEELRGWLRSLIRSAPEPDAGSAVVPLPSADSARLPVVRRRGELVRKRRAAGADTSPGRRRHKKVKERRERRPRSLGRTLLLLILLLLAAAVAYALLFMPKAGPQAPSSSPPQPSGGPISAASAGGPSPDTGGQSAEPGGRQPQTSAPAVSLAQGYVVRVDPEGFRIGVDRTWQRRPVNDSGQVRYVGGDFTLIVVPGRDTVAAAGADPMVYQRDRERELQPFRDSSWSSASGLRRIDVGKQAMAEGQFTWRDSTGRDVFVRNLAVIVGDRYHVLQVIGPEGQRDKVSEIYQQATAAYRPGG